MSRRIFPQLALALFVFTTTQVARAQESLPDLVRRVKPSVVSVLTYDAKDQPLISGSGFFVRPGEVVTNLHVINGARRVEIHTLEGKGRTYPVAGTLAVDDEADLALLKVDLPAERSRPISLSAALPEEGEQVFVWFSCFPDEAAYENYALLQSSRRRSEVAEELARHLKGPPEILKLSPTARSQLRG